MPRVWSLIRRHDLLAYPLLTFLIGWVFYVPAALVIGGHPERIGWLVIFQTPGAAAALVAGVLVRSARGGRAEVRQAWRRYRDWRGHSWWWWLAAVALVPGLAASAALAQGSFGTGAATMWAQMGWFTLAVLPLLGAAQLFTSPLLEEYGWRGFWQARLQHRIHALPAAVLVGLLWGLHHVPVTIAAGGDPWRTVVGAVGPSVLAAWLLNAGRGSMVGPMLVHAGLIMGTGYIAPDTWGFPLLTLTAAAIVGILAGPRDLGHLPRISLPPVPPSPPDPRHHDA